MGSMGNLRYGHWESRMSDGELIGIAPHLMSLLDTWIRRERAPVALQLIFGFGCRVKAVDLFIDLLVDLTHDKRGNVARSGLEALTRLGLRKRAAELIPRLVRDDPSWIQVSAVSWHLHLHRQDLLTPFLSARASTRALSQRQGGVPARLRQRLLALDGRAAAMLCRRTGQDPASTQRNAWELYGSVERYAAMPSIDLAPLVQLARLDAPDQGLRDKTLEALGRADAGRGVPELMQALDDNRARVAIYALRRS